MKDQIGSLWKKWDLHIHTPESLVNQFKGTTQEDKWENYIKDLESLPKEFKVIGINDYLFLDGYKKVVEYKNKGRLTNIELILPVLEFRIEKFAGHKDFKRVNLHVIFSDEVKAEIIEAQFLNGLQGKYKLEPGLAGIQWNGIITKDSLSDLGRAIKATIPAEEIHKFGTDLEEGFNNLNLDEKYILENLESNTYLKGKALTAIGKTEWESLSWNDQSIAVKKDIINKVDFVFISAESIEKYGVAKGKLAEQKVNDLLLDCSDAHYNSGSLEKMRIGKCYSWIKADTSFEGLKQLLNEKDRLFVGDVPPILERVKTFPTKYIKNLSISKKTGSTLSEKWFENFQIDFNVGLIAIIGKKGNGKSAITDIIALCGNSYNESYSFLTKQKFRNLKPYNRAASFEATLTWESGAKDAKELVASIDRGQPEKVKYIPQNFLETLCVTEDEQEFEKEIKKIIFSRLPNSEKLERSTLDEIIDFKSEEIKKDEKRIKAVIENLNIRINALEQKTKPGFKEGLANQLKLKEEEIKIIEANKPIEIKPPQEDDIAQEKTKIVSQQIDELKSKRNAAELSISQLSTENAKLAIEIVELDKSTQALQNLERSIRSAKEGQKAILSKYDIDVESLVSISFNLSPVVKLKEDKEKRRTEIFSQLDGAEGVTGLIQNKQAFDSEIQKLENALSEPQRFYQKYLNDLDNWRKLKIEITGFKNKEGTIEYLKDQISYVENTLPNDLEELYRQRKLETQNIFNKKTEIVSLFKDLYKPVTVFIEKYGDLMADHKIKFDVSFILEGFVEKFFDHINQGAKGSFIGKIEGLKQLQDIIDEYDFSKLEDTSAFLEKILTLLNSDYRTSPAEKRSIEDQLKKGYATTNLYDFLFGLEYLRPTFKLKLGDKNLSKLSPGERGALLLIFYLFLDFEDIPLIIDQPEENLDNESVYQYLVHFIKEAKQRRQIIIVTHNPNLAVVCDADQIIEMTIAKDRLNEVAFTSGAIENPEISSKVINVLEGTRPALNNRTSKYESVRKN
jgi:ABC-type lipoprotein export system ATPase subunit